MHLVVDLDESLIKTDLLYEQAFAFLKRNPLNIFILLQWFCLSGRLGLKRNLAKSTSLNYAALPYRDSIIAKIHEHRNLNHTIVLASASPQEWVDSISNHLGLFHHALGSSENNLKGLAKYEGICRLLNTKTFTYIGDSSSDIDIWEKCGTAITVNTHPKIVERLKRNSVLVSEIRDREPALRLLLKQMRIHQWAKNILLFVPLIAAHKLSSDLISTTLLGFISFGFAASSVYILNDLIDINSDRRHHSKKFRPLASGKIRIKDALIVLLVSSTLALSTAIAVGPPFLSAILIYWGLNLLYTFYLKKEIILDIILLSGMYTLRLFAGALAGQIVISQWLLSFSTLFFFSLACVKRFTELAKHNKGPSIDGRGYRSVDQAMILALGSGAGLLSIVVFLLYLHSNEVEKMYSNPYRLWILTPLILYWIGRLWLLTNRGEVHDDPVIFAIKDKISWACALVGLLGIYISV